MKTICKRKISNRKTPLQMSVAPNTLTTLTIVAATTAAAVENKCSIKSFSLLLTQFSIHYFSTNNSLLHFVYILA